MKTLDENQTLSPEPLDVDLKSIDAVAQLWKKSLLKEAGSKSFLSMWLEGELSSKESKKLIQYVEEEDGPFIVTGLF